jgi:hypothetical protein
MTVRFNTNWSTGQPVVICTNVVVFALTGVRQFDHLPNGFSPGTYCYDRSGKQWYIFLIKNVRSATNKIWKPVDAKHVPNKHRLAEMVYPHG